MKSRLTALAICAGLVCGPNLVADAPSPEPTEKESAEETAADAESTDKEEQKEDKKETKDKTIAELVGEHQRHDGLFPVYQDPKTGSIHLEIAEAQLGREFIYFTHTADGIASIGHFRGSFRDNQIFSVRKHFDRIEFIAENTRFYFDETNPLSRAASANISPAVLAVQKIAAEEDGRYLIKADDLFLAEAFHQVKPSPPRSGERSEERFTLGKLSRPKSKLIAIRNYPMNTDVLVEYVYENEAPTARGGEDVTDARNVSIRMQHTLIQMPENQYRPRFDDPRIGYFTDRITDLTSPSPTPYRDLIRRWHLEKLDKTAALSEPVEPIVWWIENTTPHEYRDTIRRAALAWNEAFEAAGFKNAIVVNVQPDDATWDAGDIRYNVLRWTSSPNPPFGGYGPSFANPRTGQILGADVMLEYLFVTRRMQLERVFATAGLGLDHATEDPDHSQCSLGHHLHLSTMFGSHALQASGAGSAEIGELVDSSLYYLILHELGHTLGLSHNMRSSQMHPPEDIHNKDLTAQIGLTGSVMDYPAANVALPGKEQGQYYTTKPGPYDIWAIEFGYSEALHDPLQERERLQKLLARSTEPALAFGNDADDMRGPGKAIDPRVMIGDMTSDAIGYSIGRFDLVRYTMGHLKEKYTVPGQSWHDLRNAYLVLTAEYNSAAQVISRHIGGVHVDRAIAGQPGAATPFTPVSLKDQTRAMEALRGYVLAPNAFEVPGDLYAHLQMQRRGFDFMSAPEDPKLHERILTIHKALLDHLLHKRVLQRISDSSLYGNEYTLARFTTDLTSAVFDEDAGREVNSFRQNLQAEYVRRLAEIADPKSGYDYLSQSMAIHHLESIRKLLTEKPGPSMETAAHQTHLLRLIRLALDPK